MKAVPLVLLLTSVLLASHVRPSAGRPRTVPVGEKQQLVDELLLGAAGDGAVSYLLGDTLLRVVQRTHLSAVRGANGALSPLPFDEERRIAQLDAVALSHLARSLASREKDLVGEGDSVDDLVWLSKRNDDPPLSIDLTFHLLRNMIEMAKIESQKEQAARNRKFLDEVGK